MNNKPIILAVDDTPASLALLVDILTPEGYRVLPADSGELGLAAAAANPPDLILLDVRMKGMDGLEVCRRLKAQEKTHDIPVILISAFSDVNDWVEGLRLGAADYITKPFQVQELLARVKTNLRLYQANASFEQHSAELRNVNEQLKSEIAKRQQVEDELRRNLDLADRSRRALLSAMEDQKLAEILLLDEKERIRTILDLVGDPIFVKDNDHRVTLANQAFYDMFCMDESSVLGKTLVEAVPENERHHFLKVDRRVLDTGIPSLIEESLTVKGLTRTIITRKIRFIDESGKRFLVGSIHDITGRKQAEEKINRLNADLINKNTELEQLVYVASHDLRSPLVNVQGFCKELANSLTDLSMNISQGEIAEKTAAKIAPIIRRDIPEALGFIQTSVAKMELLLTGLLKLSRLGRVAMSIQPLDIETLMPDVLRNFEFICKQKKAQICVEGALPSCRGDKVQINQVFSNLIDNAIKYLDPSRPGRIVISGKQEQDQSVYCVADNGIGMAQEHCEKVFELFHRLNPKQTEGEGLGLTIIRRSLDKQGGRVWVESEFGKGSRFFISLPIN